MSRHIGVEISLDLLASALITAVLFAVATGVPASAALSCSVTTTCNSPSVVVFRMSGTSNAHAELPSQSLYTQLVCCSASGASLSNSCSGTQVTALKLSATTNAQVEENTGTTFTNNTCFSVGAGFSVSVGYQASNCTGFDTTIASISGAANAHAGDSAAYTTKVCGTVAANSLTFIVSTENFSTITPGAIVFATSTLSIDTNNPTGWNVTVIRDDANTTMDLDSDASVNITDQTAWVPGAATSTAGNAVRIGSFANSGDVLAFRVMSASGTVAFRAPTWWGSTDAYTDNANTLWAGFPSTAKKVGESSVSSGGSPALSTVVYYLDVSETQQNGAYSGGITYTAIMNP